MARIKAVFFDLDDTLYDCSGSLVDAARRRAAKALVETGLPLSLEEAYDLQVHLTERHGPRYRVFDHIAEQYGLGKDLVDAALRAYNRDKVSDVRLFEDVLPTLRTLRDQGYLRCLVTSGVFARQERKIYILGLRAHFDEIIINDAEIGTELEECYIDLMTRHGLTPQECVCVGDRIHAEIRVANYLRMTTVQMIHGRYKSLLPKNELEEPDYRISRIGELRDILATANKRRHREHARILAIGGGTGLPIVLQGLKAYTRNLTGIVTVTDSGRSSGMLRRDLGVLPPGDARNCLIALSRSAQAGQHLHQLFQYRFADGDLSGHSFGNLFLAALEKITGSFEQAIAVASEILAVEGKVIPSTLFNTHICAKLEDGTVLKEEYNVRGENKSAIARVYLDPADATATEEAIEEIGRADAIILGPGSLFTSVITNLLVDGITRAIRGSRRYVC
jgi:FMN phosphatase YigB (HAD superfamily)